MAASSPYATFCADAWMRESFIRPRKVLAQSVEARPSMRRSASARTPNRMRSVVQGELFLFPVIVPC